VNGGDRVKRRAVLSWLFAFVCASMMFVSWFALAVVAIAGVVLCHINVVAYVRADVGAVAAHVIAALCDVCVVGFIAGMLTEDAPR